MDVSAALARESQFMGRPVQHINASETTFSGEDGVEHTGTLLVYRCKAREDEVMAPEFAASILGARWAVYVDGRPNSGGIVG